MHADELRMAVTKIVDVLIKSDIRAIVDQYRSSKGDQRTSAAARLGHAGAVIMERIDSMSPVERQVVKCLHLDMLGSAEYWQQLLGGAVEPKLHQAEIVRLASRVMFANSHLPAMISLLGSVEPPKTDTRSDIVLGSGEGGLFIRLTDAGERASDPDRVARAIDGVDMLYSACASIARKPAMDLRLDGVHCNNERDRDLRFTGERDSVSAVYAVIDSIPAALADIDPDQDIDLDVVVKSLPIFEDLNTLASLGTFSQKDLKDISDTMHQGALLTLESGVILLDSSAADETAVAPNAASVHADAVAASALPSASPAADTIKVNSNGSAQHDVKDTPADRDEHYDRYLREREAMLKPVQAASTAVNGHDTDYKASGAMQEANGAAQAQDQSKRDAIDELLKSLGQSRSS
ncbi:MAG: hypothetical protein AB8B79_13755 [Granulosicoccus sp.]